jgi:hypothetical protein
VRSVIEIRSKDRSEKVKIDGKLKCKKALQRWG